MPNCTKTNGNYCRLGCDSTSPGR